jgi:hypothetical protein
LELHFVYTDKHGDLILTNVYELFFANEERKGFRLIENEPIEITEESFKKIKEEIVKLFKNVRLKALFDGVNR